MTSYDELIQKAVEAGAAANHDRECDCAGTVEGRDPYCVMHFPVTIEEAIRAAAPIFREAYYDKGYRDGYHTTEESLLLKYQEGYRKGLEK